MPSIIEGLEDENNTYSYKTFLEGKLDPYTSRIPSLIKSGAKQVFLTHDTTTYQALRDAAQLSDFTSRYVLYEYNKRWGEITEAENFRMAMRLFVQYDAAEHQGLEYMNSVGLADRKSVV